MRRVNLKDESGQTMILTVLALTVLLGIVAFAVDVGLMFHAKRNLQIAADSAAVAAASELNYGDWSAAGQAGAAQNGATNGSNGTTVVINSPPVNGPHAGLAGYAEAIVTQSEPTYFMRVFNRSAMTVTTRAVAYNGGSADGCVFVCNPSAADAMDLQGSFNVSAPKCGVVVESNNPDALQFTGGAGSLTAGSVGVAGGDGGQVGDSTPAPVTGMPQQGCPLSFIVAPDPTTMTCVTPVGGMLGGTSTQTTINPGCYSAPAGGTLTLNNVTLNSGTYVLTGNVVLSGNVETIAGGGTTLDIATGSFSEGTAATYINLVAPTPGTGSLAGIALMEPATNSNLMLFEFGNSSGLIDGIIYAPSAELELHDSGGDKSGGIQLITDLIVDTLYDQTGTLNITSYSQTTPGNGPLTKIALVE